MPVKQVEFIKSSTTISQCPNDMQAEYAFLGRSNVGKSSLINYLTNKIKLAKTSGKPGHTRVINHFLVNNLWYLVDLPGYGYAKVGKKERAEFEKIIYDYLLGAEKLICLFLLIDCRHSPLQIDLDFMQWLGENEIPFAIVFTKTDKLGVTKLNKAISDYKTKLLEYWEYLPETFQTSTLKRQGGEQILEYIEGLNDSIIK